MNEGKYPNHTFIMDPEVPLKGILSIVTIHLIHDKPTHGGEIYQKLKDVFLFSPPRGIIYALLRRMESEGLIISTWDIQQSGPARRMYRITEQGAAYLKTGIERVKKTSRIINVLLDNYNLNN